MYEAEVVFKQTLAVETSESPQTALALYKKALSLCPNDSRYWIAYGMCLGKFNHWTEAAKALKKGIALKPHYAEANARLFLAEALIKNGKTKDAIKELKFVANMKPCYPSYEIPMNQAKRILQELVR
jgi:tetratricopeptide (TPR) repeat protein